MFSKKPDPRRRAAPLPAAGGKSMGAANTFSVLGGDMTIRGNIEASTELHIDGRVEGDISCASLVQGEASIIEGAVQADSARLAGRVQGSVTAKELVILRTARVEGDVHYDALTIEQGAEVEGRFSHRVPGKATPAHLPAADGNGEDVALPLTN